MRADRMIRQLLQYGNQQELNRRPVKASELIDGALVLNGGLMEAKSLRIQTVLDKNTPLLYVDSERISQVLINLLQNAIDASPIGESIEVYCGVDPKKECVVVKITDRGSGIPGELQEKIFTPFFSRKKGGSGMGLPISLRIVKDHGGGLRVESVEGRGSTFIMELPRVGDPQGS